MFTQLSQQSSILYFCYISLTPTEHVPRNESNNEKLPVTPQNTQIIRIHYYKTSKILAHRDGRRQWLEWSSRTTEVPFVEQSHNIGCGRTRDLIYKWRSPSSPHWLAFRVRKSLYDPTVGIREPGQFNISSLRDKVCECLMDRGCQRSPYT